MQKSLSTTIAQFLKQHPLLISYSQKGLININALAKHVKENNPAIDKNISDAAISMDIRRFLAKRKESVVDLTYLSPYSLQIIARSNIKEVILIKNTKNRLYGLSLVKKISETNNFVSLVEGEKEIVIMTDYQIKDVIKHVHAQYIEGLSFISINFPIEMRTLPGIYSTITSSLAQANISIHSFHTIGGEILVLVKDIDLVKTQEILQFLLDKPTY